MPRLVSRLIGNLMTFTLYVCQGDMQSRSGLSCGMWTCTVVLVSREDVQSCNGLA